MANDEQWRIAFAKQALSDKQVYEYLCENNLLHVCQGLHFLQMTFEKLCKANLFDPKKKSSRPGKILRSHSIIEKHMPIIYKDFYSDSSNKVESWEMSQIRDLCRKINKLSPSVPPRNENCEYPWEKNSLSGNNTFIVAPVDHEFAIANDIKSHIGIKLLRCLSALLKGIVDAE